MFAQDPSRASSLSTPRNKEFVLAEVLFFLSLSLHVSSSFELGIKLVHWPNYRWTFNSYFSHEFLQGISNKLFIFEYLFIEKHFCD